MNKREVNRVRLAPAIFVLAATCIGNQAYASGNTGVPLVACVISESGQCVAFAASGEITGCYDLGGVSNSGCDQKSARVTNFTVENAALWNTTAPVKLIDAPDADSSCPRTDKFVDVSKSPMNLSGSHLFINEGNVQYMYLVYNNISIERPLTAKTRPRTKDPKNNEVMWLQALQQTGAGDKNPFDYFIEFRKTKNNSKAYRVEAFPHRASPDAPLSPCDNERPDVQYGAKTGMASKAANAPKESMTSKVASTSHGSKPVDVHMMEPTVGEGDEPGHD